MAKNCGTCNRLGNLGHPTGYEYYNPIRNTYEVAQACNSGCECEHQRQGVYMPDGTFHPTSGASVNYDPNAVPLFWDIYGRISPTYPGGPSAWTNPDNPYTFEEFQANSVGNSYTCKGVSQSGPNVAQQNRVGKVRKTGVAQQNKQRFSGFTGTAEGQVMSIQDYIDEVA
tara:strand:- start:2731 stop:3240 length:510 start_codon:yes stop_codon:yes gene_type:complete